MQYITGIKICDGTSNKLSTSYLSIKDGIYKVVFLTGEPICNLELFYNLNLDSEISESTNQSLLKLIMFREINSSSLQNNERAKNFLGYKEFKGNFYCFLKKDDRYYDFSEYIFENYNKKLIEKRKKSSISHSIKEKSEKKEEVIKISSEKITVCQHINMKNNISYMIELAVKDHVFISKHLKEFSSKEYAKMIIDDDLPTYMKFHSIKALSELEINAAEFDRNLTKLSKSKSIFKFLNENTLKVINIGTYKETVISIIIDYIKELFDQDTSIHEQLISDFDFDYIDKYLYFLKNPKNIIQDDKFFMLIPFMKTLSINGMLKITHKMMNLSYKYDNRLLFEVLA
tara:strand:+ start:1821 stop:2852 length:1032 start_codon:yes stop_codon:yes gene_type:complete